MDALLWWLLKSLFKFIAWIFKQLFSGSKKLLEEAQKLDPNYVPPSVPNESLASWAQETLDEQRQQLAQSLVGIGEGAKALREQIRRDRASEHLGAALEKYIAARAREGAGRVRQADVTELSRWRREVDWLTTALDAVRDMVEQRGMPERRGALGDADALAMACYRPILEFAAMQRVPLSSALPVTVLSEFDLSIWTGFATTGLAPIFLPEDFFERLAWWPALAHEIGHDVLVSTRAADRALRVQFGLSSEDVGRVPLGVRTQQINHEELYRLAGGWFEEIFCDVFATLMLGPAYVLTMEELFSSPGDPSVVTRQGLDLEAGLYARHPPRHLRVDLCCRLLGRMGHAQEGNALWEEWQSLHGHPDSIEFAVPGGAVAIPVDPLFEICESIAERLYESSLVAFDGHSLAAIPGMDHGPHEWKEAERTRDALLAGRAPKRHEPKAIIGGAILAWKAQPEREQEFLRAARAAIVGVTEWAEAGTRDRADGAARGGARTGARGAFLLHTMFAPPLALARSRALTPGPLARPLAPRGSAATHRPRVSARD